MTRRVAVLALLLAAALGGCARRELAATHGWARLPANPGAPAAGYVTLKGGAMPAMLVSVAADRAANAEMHESMTMAGGMTGMAPLARVEVPAGGEVAFSPGGRHIMLFGVDPALRPGGAMTLTLTFADGRRLAAPLKVVGAGEPAPY